MGTFTSPLRIADVNGRQSREVEATVDTGAAYTVLPGRLLRELNVEPLGQRRLLLADGRRMNAHIGEARATIDGETVTTLVIFGEDDAPPLLGAYTLEGLGLAVDPVEQRLVPAHLIMYQARLSPLPALA
ncbi:MAG: retroviral-like aspartic protease family protein [Chloroflexi bacterium]|nr:retroviral-like aspartic protease family protein [Chloroflexota bacterium]